MNASTQTQPGAIARTSRPIDVLASLPDIPVVVAQSADKLYAIEESAIAKSIEGETPLSLDDESACRRIANGVEQGFSLNAASGTLACVRSGRVQMCSLRDPSKSQRVPVPGVDGELAGATVSDDGSSLLVAVYDESDPHFARQQVVCIDVLARKTRTIAEISSVVALRVFWSATAKAFFVLDRCAEALWRVRPNETAAERVPTERASGRSIIDVCPHPHGAWLMLVLQDPQQNRTHLMQGVVAESSVRWESVVALTEGIHAGFCWHPSQRMLACQRTVRRRSFLEVINALGVTTASQELPRNGICNSLAWSGDGKSVYAASPAGIRVWKPAGEER